MHFSKTNFLQYIQCPKLLWHSVNTPEMLTAPDSSSTSRMLAGLSVESYARKLLPECTVIDHSQPFDDVLAQSNDAISRSSSPICNAIVSAQDLVAETDILIPAEDEFDIYEIKSSTTAKPEHIPDISFQKYVAEKRGLRIRRCCLILINGKYVRKGEINPKQLFKVGDVTNGVQEYCEVHDIATQVNNAILTCRFESAPVIDIGLQCSDDCPMRSQCWKLVDSTKNNVFSLYRLRRKTAFSWHSQGLIRNSELHPDYKLTEKQKIQITAESTGKVHVDKKAVSNFHKRLESPLNFLDFETFSSPLPPVDGSSPYEQLPFQFSLHVIENDLEEEPKHHSWIWDTEGDPRQVMLEKLKALLGNTGSIIAYNAMFEQMILRQAVKVCPEHEEWLTGILERFKDLLTPFRDFSIYHPEQHGSCSLKAVLPALTGIDYSSLEIQDGGMASEAFMGILSGDVKGARKTATLKHLEKYCGQDTFGMVEILRRLKIMSS